MKIGSEETFLYHFMRELRFMLPLHWLSSALKGQDFKSLDKERGVSAFVQNQTDKCSFSYLIKFTKIAPQLSTEELTFLGKEMVTALTTCCTLSEEFACVDNLVSVVHILDYVPQPPQNNIVLINL